ncbi:MAG: isocitrate/isopropylmalate family dehydrogenase [Phycisphaerales bacterium]
MVREGAGQRRGLDAHHEARGARASAARASSTPRSSTAKSVTLVEKPNVLRETGGLMTRVFRKVAKDYPGIEAWEANIDAICMWMVKNPQNYDVLVAENMFGDIISDLCAGLVGGLGFACAANIGDEYAVFEPTHGSAPKYDGKNVVNPMAMILTAKMMLDWLGEKSDAERLEAACAAVIKENTIGTYDVKGVRAGQPGSNSTTEVAQAVAAKL